VVRKAAERSPRLPPVYQALLTRRYLTSKVMPLLAAIAVMLCVAMELIVWSVMGGFLVMLLESGRTLIGDVAIASGTRGIAYYDDLVKRLEADPMIEAASPTIESFGMVSLPLWDTPETVVLKGIDPESFDRVTKYRESLWWKPLDKPLPKDTLREDPRVQPDLKDAFAGFFQEGASLSTGLGHAGPAGAGAAAMVTGVEVAPYNHRMPGGWLKPEGVDIPVLMRQPGGNAVLSVWPIGERGRLIGQPVSKSFPIVNQFRTGIYEVDNNTVLVRLDALQKMLRMEQAQRIDPTSGVSGLPVRIIGPDGKERFEVPADQQAKMITDPARVNNILIRGRGDVDALVLRDRVKEIYQEFAAAHALDVRPPPPLGHTSIMTWRDKNQTLISAVENETRMVLFIFGIISLTSVFLVLAIFWAMVSEKTKDIGVLRAIGASRRGVAWIWLRYGLGIGIVGSLLGVSAAYLIVTNINPIHEWLGELTGHPIWDPKVYYFSSIPNKINPVHAVYVVAGGIIASVAGALVPAIKAAWMDPVKALRWE
jgi:lipoprotein-releasing system permease protein